jgi:LysM repeat protein
MAVANAQGSSLPSLNLQTAENPKTHTVKPGESLSAIAKQYFGSPNYYTEIFKANQSSTFKHPNTPLRVGQELKLPQHLFPDNDPNTPEPAKASTLIQQYHQQNPLSFLTLDRPNRSAATETMGPPAPTGLLQPQGADNLPLLDFWRRDLVKPNPTGNAATVEHVDAVKVNKTFDIHPAMTAGNMAAQFPQWARKVADTLEANQATIALPGPNGQTLKADATFMRGLADQAMPKGGFDGVKTQLSSHLAFFNSMYAIDDVVNNLKNDPYYEEIKGDPKTIDLQSVADSFHLGDDSKNYLGGVKAHKHRQIPVNVATDLASLNGRTHKNADALIQGLAGNFNSRGVLTNPTQFEEQVYSLLNNPGARAKLIQQFDLDSEENLKALIPSMTSESGMSASHIDYNSYFAVGAVMMNRALGRNIKKAAAELAKGKALDTVKPVKMHDIIHEQGQFEIVWRKMPGSNSTFYGHSKNLHTAFLQGKLPEGGNGHNAFEMAYEVSKDLLSGMNRLSAEVNGETRKGVGRSTGELFYFNQSRSYDYSSESRQNSAVELIDKNNTHVFFKAWDDIAYFR